MSDLLIRIYLLLLSSFCSWSFTITFYFFKLCEFKVIILIFLLYLGVTTFVTRKRMKINSNVWRETDEAFHILRRVISNLILLNALYMYHSSIDLRCIKPIKANMKILPINISPSMDTFTLSLNFSFCSSSCLQISIHAF